jgi:LmbE family N-acetylglucosaminyl deacetylase
MEQFPKTVLALMPHPDDAEFSCGGTLARFAQEGCRVIIVIATDGRKGSFTLDSNALIEARAEEAHRAARTLGARPPIMLGHADMGLDQLTPGLLREEFIQAIRRYRPMTVIAQDPYIPREAHPDHRAVAWAAYEAVHFSALPLVHPEYQTLGLQPYFPPEKLFYGCAPDAATVFYDISDTVDTAIAALLQHRSQVEFLVQDVLMQASLAGINPLEAAGNLPQDPDSLMGWFMRQQAAETGKRYGVAYAEAFRRERFHPAIEALIP